MKKVDFSKKLRCVRYPSYEVEVLKSFKCGNDDFWVVFLKYDRSSMVYIVDEYGRSGCFNIVENVTVRKTKWVNLFHRQDSNTIYCGNGKWNSFVEAEDIGKYYEDKPYADPNITYLTTTQVELEVYDD